jgi:hypothetical protein
MTDQQIGGAFGMSQTSLVRHVLSILFNLNLRTRREVSRLAQRETRTA